MERIVDWAAAHARMVLAVMFLSIGVGISAYFGLPKEGAPDIEFPGYFISVPYPGISAEDSEELLVKPLEDRLQNVDGLEYIQSTSAEGYAGVFLQFEFGLDRGATLADIRDKVSQAEADFPSGASEPIVSEFSFADFPIIIVVMSGNLPERTMQIIADDLKVEIETIPGVLEAGITGARSEMLEVIIDPLQLEAYNITAGELINVVTRNNQLIAAGDVESSSGAFAVKVPASFNDAQDVYQLPIKVSGDRIVTLGDLAEINMTFEDRVGIARHNGESTIALQVVKRKGFNVIDTAREVRERVSAVQEKWPSELANAVKIDFVQDISSAVQSMVTQLQSSVMTAVILVMIVVLSTLGIRSALLVGFAVPSSFLLCFTFLAVLEIAISNIVMFGLILAVGMLVDSAIVVVELADRRISEGSRPMSAYVEAAKRMFWPIVSSTATTLCAFLPMLFWPGIPGQFMGTLPVTLIFVLSASLFVALIFLPVVGGVAGRIGARMTVASQLLLRLNWAVRALLTVLFALGLFGAAWFMLNPAILFNGMLPFGSIYSSLPGTVMFVLFSIGLIISIASLRSRYTQRRMQRRRRRTPFGWFIKLIVGNPVMPVVVLGLTVAFMFGVVQYYSRNNHGVTFFVDTEPERAMIYVLARGNLSLHEKDGLVESIERKVLGLDGVSSVFSTTGEGGINNQGGINSPADTIGQIQLEFDLWENRQLLGGQAADTRDIIDQVKDILAVTPGINTDIRPEDSGPQQGKPISLRLTSTNWDDLTAAALIVRERYENTKGLVFIDDSLPLPGIDWQVDIDIEKAGRYGADVATVGAMIQLVTRGVLLDTMRIDTSSEEVDIRVRFPEKDRLLTTLTNLRIRTPSGLVPLTNFVKITPVKQLSEIERYNQERFILVNADLTPGLRNSENLPITPSERIAKLTEWLTDEADLPLSVSWEWTGDQEEQAESQTFLMYAFIGALGLMFAVLLAQFNSVYNSLLVLFAVVLSTTGVLIGMIVMQHPFSVIMTGTGIVSLAGIVVNNNIVLIDTYQDYARYMPRLEAIIRTAEVRIRPVLLTTITTMAGLTPMMLGWSIDLVNGGYTVDTPTSLWWKQLATSVIFGLGTATGLTLVVTPSLLAIPVWLSKTGSHSGRLILSIAGGRSSRVSLDRALYSDVAKLDSVTLSWDQLQNVLLPVYPARDEYPLENPSSADNTDLVPYLPETNEVIDVSPGDEHQKLDNGQSNS